MEGKCNLRKSAHSTVLGHWVNLRQTSSEVDRWDQGSYQVSPRITGHKREERLGVERLGFPKAVGVGGRPGGQLVAGRILLL